MAPSVNTEPDALTAEPTTSPGRMLAAARESRSLSPAELAVRLRLSPRTIKALERDDFENLPAATFIKGYIRAIAKELDIDPDPVINAYVSHVTTEPPELADFSSRPPDQISANSTVVKAVTYGLGIFLLLMSVQWWRGTDHKPDRSATGLDESEIAAITAADPLPYQFEIVEHDDHGWRIERTLSEVNPDTYMPEGEGDYLFISTTSESWIEIYDADGGRLFYGLAKSGEPVRLGQQPYYRLLIGNVESVTLRYHEKLIDLTPYTHEDVAKLELSAPPGSDPTAQ